MLIPAVLGVGIGLGSSEPNPPTPAQGGGEVDPVASTVNPSPAAARIEEPEETGAQLFNRLCASCHGVNGDGAGPAARFLSPKPRDFQNEPFRLVSTTNMVPSDEDLMRVLEHGMPGSSMFSFAHLSRERRETLVGHVRELVRRGLMERLKREAAEFEEELDPEMAAEIIEARTEPGPALDFPSDWPAEDADSVARGRELYAKPACASCHGETGRGDGVQEQRDDLGRPIQPRDYTQGVFKGGRDRESLYARIALGMPGSPMPSSPALNPGEIADLVHFIRSLSDPSVESQVVQHRTTIQAVRTAAPLPKAISEAAWKVAEATPIVVSPLWWRDDFEVDLRVQALQDGHDLAIRLSWKDATRNSRAIQVDEFPDMAAVQLFQGTLEPFLGMGGAGEPVNLWLWNAAAEADQKEYADVDTVYPEMVVDDYPFAKEADGRRPNATRSQPREFLTAWAAGNLRSDPTHPLAGSALQAEGPGSVTLRPPIAQGVRARGEWREGRWSVVLRSSMDGFSDGRVSIAFALWDGAKRDRDGQKLVSIWHDLERP